MKWTKAQRKVIDTRDRNILVSAAAGSGKTAVLVERIVSMITDKEHPVDIDRLLVVTFTRAAASEMKERILGRLEEIADENPGDENIQRQLSLVHNAQITTIDSFCAMVVKENFEKIDLDPNYRIAGDDAELELIRSDIIEDMLEEYYEKGDQDFLNLAGQYLKGKASDNIAGLIESMYQNAMKHVDPEDFLSHCADDYDVEKKEDILESSWMDDLLDEVRVELDTMISSLDVAIGISESPDGPKNGAKLQDVIDIIRGVRSKEGYFEMRDALEKAALDIKRVRLSNAEGCDEVKKQRVADIKSKDVNQKINKKKSGILDKYFEDLDEVISDMRDSFKSVNMIADLTKDFIKRYKKEKLDRGVLEFDDVSHYALNILNDVDEDGNLVPSDTAREMSKDYDEIMIDEYQDSNYIQEAILKSVSKGNGHENMFMVGDVKQSIYSFRKADPKLFLEKYNTYSDNLGEDFVRIILDQNFRSRQEVIDSVNYIFDYIMHPAIGGIDYRDGNELRLGADYEEAPKGQDNRSEFILIKTNKESDEAKSVEAAYVAGKIRQITDPDTGMKITEKGKGMRPVSYGDITILLRSMKGVAETYVQEFEKQGIPVYAETKTGFYDAVEVQDVLSMLRIIDNPLQDIPLAAAMSGQMGGFSPEEMAEIKLYGNGGYMYNHLEAYAMDGSEGELQKKSENFMRMLEDFREKANYTCVYDMIQEILDKTGYEYYIKAMPGGKKRYLNILTLKEKAKDYDKTSYKGMFHFVRYVEKIKEHSQDEGESSSVGENDDIVRIMSIHKSKGLQFPVVFLCNTSGGSKNDNDSIVMDEDGHIGVDYIDPRRKVKKNTLLKKEIKLRNKKEDAAEKLRILYVAMTRAKEKLFITSVAEDGDINKFAEKRYDTSKILPYGDIKNDSIRNLIGKALARNKVFDPFIADDIMHVEDTKIYEADCAFTVQVISEDDVDVLSADNGFAKKSPEDSLDDIDNETYEKTKHMLEGYFDYKYPFARDVILHSKASVTELERQSSSYDEEQDGYAVYKNESDHVPAFATTDKDAPKGAERGSVYHKVFELMNFEKQDYSGEAVKGMLDGFVRDGIFTEQEISAVDPMDIVKFSQTSLYKRMSIAYEKNELYRERKFLLGVPVNEIYSDSNSSETMIIQGIIDACFLENDEYVLLDYKTDRVHEFKELEDKYRLQLSSYKKALEQISGKKVKEMIIYSVFLAEAGTIGDTGVTK